MNAITNLAPENADSAIKELILAHVGSKKYAMMQTGEAYYLTENEEISAREFYVYAENDKHEAVLIKDVYKANNKMASSFYKIQVDQKINYSIGNQISYESAQSDQLIEIMGGNFQKTLKRVAKDASKKSIGWAQANINSQGKFELIRIPSEQIVPVYKDADGEELEYVVRYYTIKVLNEKGEAKKVTQAEVWDDEQVAIYRQRIDTDIFVLLGEKDGIFNNPRYHFSRDMKFGETVKERRGQSWGKVPFIPLYNNDDEIYDLQPIKNYVDVYDIVQSDFANNLEDFQDIYWVLRGYSGTDVNTFLTEVKQYKALKVAADGDAHAEKIEVPYEARQAELKNLEDCIFKFGMAVDIGRLTGSSVTNVMIKAMFANLDLKANDFEQQIKDFIWRVLYFVNVYAKQTSKPEIVLDKVTFTRGLIINEVELLEANTKQQGNVSEHTRLANHRWVSDVEEEKRLLEEERGSITIPDEDDDE